MRAVQRAQQRTAQTQRISPRQVAAAEMLVMSSEQLQLHVEQEADLNPALEIVWESSCSTCGRGLSNGVCWYCRWVSENGSGGLSRYEPPSYARRNHDDGDDDAYDPLEHIHKSLSLREHVLLQSRLVLPPQDMPIAEYLVAELNDDGLLDTSPEEAAEALGVDQERVRQVAVQLQSLDPPGVCAFSVQESVLIQLRELAAEAPVPPLVEPMLTRHWRDLANHSYEKISRALHVPPEAVDEALAFIRESFCPYPGRLYHAPHGDSQDKSLGVARPDVIVRRELADYVVEVVSPFDFELRVSEAYRRLYRASRSGGDGSPGHRQALEQYNRATWLLHSLALREQTLRQITEYVVAVQRPFLDTESRAKMKPLTRTHVAQHIGKHTSTVSRATANKFVLLPNSDLVPFDVFFSPAIAQKTVVAEVLSKEDPNHPLTDEQIRHILRIHGFRVARRTVAKWRLALRVPRAAQRGRH